MFFLRSTLGIIVVADDACDDKLESQVNTYVEYELCPDLDTGFISLNQEVLVNRLTNQEHIMRDFSGGYMVTHMSQECSEITAAGAGNIPCEVEMERLQCEGCHAGPQHPGLSLRDPRGNRRWGQAHPAGGRP